MSDAAPPIPPVTPPAAATPGVGEKNADEPGLDGADERTPAAPPDFAAEYLRPVTFDQVRSDTPAVVAYELGRLNARMAARVALAADLTRWERLRLEAYETFVAEKDGWLYRPIRPSVTTGVTPEAGWAIEMLTAPGVIEPHAVRDAIRETYKTIERWAEGVARLEAEVWQEDQHPRYEVDHPPDQLIEEVGRYQAQLDAYGAAIRSHLREFERLELAVVDHLARAASRSPALATAYYLGESIGRAETPRDTWARTGTTPRGCGAGDDDDDNDDDDDDGSLFAVMRRLVGTVPEGLRERILLDAATQIRAEWTERRLPAVPCELAPADGWVGVLHEAWQLAGITPDAFPEPPTLTLRADVPLPGWLTPQSRGALHAFLGEVDRVAMSALADRGGVDTTGSDAAAGASAAKPGYLGLTVDQQAKKVWRQRESEEVSEDSKRDVQSVAIAAFRAFAGSAASEGRLTLDELDQARRNYTNRSAKSTSAVEQMISQARIVLKNYPGDSTLPEHQRLDRLKIPHRTDGFYTLTVLEPDNGGD